MKHITLSNILATIGLILIALGCCVDIFTTYGWFVKIPLLIGGFIIFVLGYIEGGNKFGSY